MSKVDRGLAWVLGLMQLAAGASGAIMVLWYLQLHELIAQAGVSPEDWDPMLPGPRLLVAAGGVCLLAISAGICLFFSVRRGAQLALLALLPQALSFVAAPVLYSFCLGPDWGVELAFHCEGVSCGLERATYQPLRWMPDFRLETDRCGGWIGLSPNFAVLLQMALAGWMLWRCRRIGARQ